MKFIYITSHRYPSKKTEPFFIRSMAEAFYGVLGQDFSFVVRGTVPDELKRINASSVNVPKRLRATSYFLLMPFIVVSRKWNDRQTVFFSSDPYLLSVLVFWRKILGFRYSICSDWHQLFGDWRDRYVAGHSDFLVSTSKRLKGLLSSVCGADRDKIVVAYGGVDTAIFEANSRSDRAELRAGLALPADAFLVGYVGGFKAIGMEKGLGTMIKSLPRLNDKIKMAFVGGLKQDIDEYALLAKKEKVEGRCIFVERQRSFEKVVRYEMAMDALVIPYPNEKHFRDYGFPMKVWEYMASGRPIVYSDLEIIAEVLDGKAVRFKADDPWALTGAIMSVYNGRDSAEKAARQNSLDVRAYTWEARAANIIRFIIK